MALLCFSGCLDFELFSVSYRPKHFTGVFLVLGKSGYEFFDIVLGRFTTFIGFKGITFPDFIFLAESHGRMQFCLGVGFASMCKKLGYFA
jgi:hypothetical protein